MKEKFDELHAKEVTPEEFEEMWGESKEEAKRKVMDFVGRFLKAKAECDKKKHKRTAKAELKAAAAIELDPAAVPAAAQPAAAERADRRKSAKQDVEQIKNRATRIAEDRLRQSQPERLVAPQIQIGRAAKTIGELVIEVKLENEEINKKFVATPTVFVNPVKGKGNDVIKKAACSKTKGKAASGKLAKGTRGPKGGGGPR